MVGHKQGGAMRSVFWLLGLGALAVALALLVVAAELSPMATSFERPRCRQPARHSYHLCPQQPGSHRRHLREGCHAERSMGLDVGYHHAKAA